MSQDVAARGELAFIEDHREHDVRDASADASLKGNHQAGEVALDFRPARREESVFFRLAGRSLAQSVLCEATVPSMSALRGGSGVLCGAHHRLVGLTASWPPLPLGWAATFDGPDIFWGDVVGGCVLEGAYSARQSRQCGFLLLCMLLHAVFELTHEHAHRGQQLPLHGLELRFEHGFQLAHEIRRLPRGRITALRLILTTEIRSRYLGARHSDAECLLIYIPWYTIV